MDRARNYEVSTEMERRVFLRRLITAGGALSLTALAAACGANKSTSAAPSSATGAPTSGNALTTAAAVPTTTSAAAPTTGKAAGSTPVTTASPAGVTTAAGTATKPAAGGKAFDVAKEVVISYSYVADMTASGGNGGRINNPYIAVWIEGADGAIVRNVSVSYQAGRGDRWLNELHRWFAAEKAYVAKGGPASIQTISSATRVAGSYKVVWDGLDETKQPVALGDYFVCIEASRERGPYQLVRESVAIGSDAVVKALADNGELQKVSVELRARR